MHYQKPSAIGGTLIRKVIQNFKQQKFALPIEEPILIATSGGVDSMALAHLVATYGRKIISPEQISLLHFDHLWRKESGTVEKKAVQKLAKELGVHFLGVKLEKPITTNRLNWEEDARRKRNAFYFSQKKARYIFTAHHQNDLSETLLWRFLRGEFDENREGILFQDDLVLRPLLQVTKQELYAYAKAEKVPYFEDPTNNDTSQMRSFLRKELFPLLQNQFPAIQETIASYAQSASFPADSNLLTGQVATHAIEQIAAKLNRAQKNAISKAIETSLRVKTTTAASSPPKPKAVSQRITLPGGVVLTSESKADGTRFLIEIIDQPIQG